MTALRKKMLYLKRHEKWNVAKTCEMKCTVFGLGVDETPGDTVSHSDGSRLTRWQHTQEVHSGVGPVRSAESCFNIIWVETITLEEGKWQWPRNENRTKSELLLRIFPVTCHRVFSSIHHGIYWFFFVFYPIRVTAFVGHSRSLWWWVIMTVRTWVLWLLHHGVLLFFRLHPSSVVL